MQDAAFASANFASDPVNSSGIQPYTIVLQPGREVSTLDSLEFQQALKQALDAATDAVVVDLLWVESVNAQGISVLMAGIQHAIASGKSLSFQSIDPATRRVLDAEYHRQRALTFGSWENSFTEDLEQFLDSHTPHQLAQASIATSSDNPQSMPFFGYPAIDDASRVVVFRTQQPA